MKRFFELITIILLLSLSWGSSLVVAEHIEHYEVNMTLAPSGEFVVTESIVYNFNGTQKHGIYRDIPTNAYSMGSVDGVKWGVHFDIELASFDVTMDNQKVDWSKEILSISGKENIRLKVGSSEKKVSGERVYRITYHCRNAIMPLSFQAGRDKLYWHAIGEGWSVPILRSELNLFLPENLQQEKIKQITHKKDQSRSVWLTPRHLQIRSTGPQLWIDIQFPRGLLTQSGEVKIKAGVESVKRREKAKHQDTLEAVKRTEERKNAIKLQRKEREEIGIWSWIAMIVFLGILWHKRERLGLKKQTRSIIVRYSPPKYLSVLQAGLLYDKDLGKDNFYAAILELAYLGYIKIEGDEEGVVIQRIAGARGVLSADQQALLAALFESGECFSTKEASASQYATLSSRIHTIYKRLYIWGKEEGYTVENFSTLRGRILKKIFIMALPLFIFSIAVAMNGHYTGEEVSYILFCIFVALLPWFILSFFTSSFGIQSSALTLGLLGWYMLMEWEIFPKQGAMDTVAVMGSYITVVTLLVIVAMRIVWKMGRYRQKGEDALLEIKGLERFIESVKEDEMRRRIESEPDYMEKLFPYAVLFGQGKHWSQLDDNLDRPHLKGNHSTLWKSLVRSNLLRSQSSSSGGRFLLSSSGSGSSGGSSSGGAGGGGGGSW